MNLKKLYRFYYKMDCLYYQEIIKTNFNIL